MRACVCVCALMHACVCVCMCITVHYIRVHLDRWMVLYVCMQLCIIKDDGIKVLP